MAFNDGQLSTFVATNGFDPGLVWRAGTRRAHPRIGEYVEAKWKDGKWYPGRIEKVDGGNVLDPLGSGTMRARTKGSG